MQDIFMSIATAVKMAEYYSELQVGCPMQNLNSSINLGCFLIDVWLFLNGCMFLLLLLQSNLDNNSLL